MVFIEFVPDGLAHQATWPPPLRKAAATASGFLGCDNSIQALNGQMVNPRACEAHACTSPAILRIQGIAVCAVHAKEVAEYAQTARLLDAETLDAADIREFLAMPGGGSPA